MKKEIPHIHTSNMPWLKRSRLSGENKCADTLEAPALSPNIVIMLGSPPKAEKQMIFQMLLKCHVRFDS